MPGGGPGNPMAFGKSKAKFQMEPNTGITFADVAGVDEAKQDFEEVGAVQRGRFEMLHFTTPSPELCVQGKWIS